MSNYYDTRPAYYERKSLREQIKEHWKLFLVSAISALIGVGLAIYIGLMTQSPQLLLLIEILFMVPFILTMVYTSKVEDKRWKQSLEDIKEWDNKPEIKEKKKAESKNILIFHHAGYITGGMYMLKQQVPEYNYIKKLLCNEDNLLVVELTDEQKQKLLNNEKIELSLENDDSLTLNGKFSKNTTKLYVNI